MNARRYWPKHLFRFKHTGDLTPGELIWKENGRYSDEASGPYRVKRVEMACPGQIIVQIVGMENSGTFQMAWGQALVPRYR